MTNDQKLHSIALLVCTKISQFKLSSFYSNRLPPLTIHIKIRKLFCARITQPFSVPKIVLREHRATVSKNCFTQNWSGKRLRRSCAFWEKFLLCSPPTHSYPRFGVFQPPSGKRSWFFVELKRRSCCAPGRIGWFFVNWRSVLLGCAEVITFGLMSFFGSEWEFVFFE